MVGVSPQTLAVGGAFTAVILGLAAQQTLGNVFAGVVLLTARPFKVGERVRLQAGVVGGTAEGTVSSLGLLYTTLTQGYDRMLIPNNVVLAAAIVPLREPESVDVKVRLSSGVRPTQVQAILDNEVTTPTRSKATVLLEEIDGDQLVVRVQATPELAHRRRRARRPDHRRPVVGHRRARRRSTPTRSTAPATAARASDDLSSAPTMRARAASTPEREPEGDGARGPSDRPSIRRGPARVRE